ncbi:hypothetical protein TRIP_D450020 [uncultured Paludibacter sp.]|nr:hypothetical protein TRIP_D450020 [uncultured Paludibacter sp.]
MRYFNILFYNDKKTPNIHYVASSYLLSANKSKFSKQPHK